MNIGSACAWVAHEKTKPIDSQTLLLAWLLSQGDQVPESVVEDMEKWPRIKKIKQSLTLIQQRLNPAPAREAVTFTPKPPPGPPPEYLLKLQETKESVLSLESEVTEARAHVQRLESELIHETGRRLTAEGDAQQLQVQHSLDDAENGRQAEEIARLTALVHGFKVSEATYQHELELVRAENARLAKSDEEDFDLCH